MTENNILRAVRASKNETLEDMANLLGLKSASAYSQKEKGVTKFRPEEMKTLANHFDLTVDDLFFAPEVRITRTQQ